MRWSRILAGAAALAAVTVSMASCGDSESGGRQTSYVDASWKRLEPLGWLGGRAQPLTRNLTVEDDDRERSPGGVVVREVIGGEPLATAGLRAGDVIVRVGESWVPLKENPVADFLELVEQAVSAGAKQIDLGIWRAGALRTVAMAADLPALEDGLPVQVKRLAAGAGAALDRLAAQGADDGSFAAESHELALDAAVGLALIAGGAAQEDASADRAQVLERVERRIDEVLAAATDADAFDLAWALMFLAERTGPLPAEILVRAGGTGPAGHPPAGGLEVAHGGAMKLEISSPEEMKKMLESMGGGKGGVTVMTTGPGGSGGLDPSKMKIVDAAELGLDPSELKIGGSGGDLPPPPPPAERLAAMLDELDPARRPQLKRLAAVAARICRMQADDGSWPIDAGDEHDGVVATCRVLTALGMLQRVGGTIDAEAAGGAVRFLRKSLREGNLAAAVARGADRRVQAGLAAHAAHALRAVGCPDGDELLSKLLTFSDRRGRFAATAPRGRAFHVLATALLRRSRGLPAWQSFYDDFRIRLVAAQRPDGSFESWSGEDATELDRRVEGELFATAIGAIVLSLQSERVPVLLAKAENPLATAIDGEGNPIAPAASPLPPAGIITGAPITDPAEAEKLLKSLGIEGGLKGLLEKAGKGAGHGKGSKKKP